MGRLNANGQLGHAPGRPNPMGKGQYFVLTAKDGFVPQCRHSGFEMLQDARMAGLVKLRCSDRLRDERQQWAVSSSVSGLVLVVAPRTMLVGDNGLVL